VANSPTRLHELQKLLPTAAIGSSPAETRNLDQQKAEVEPAKADEPVTTAIPKFLQFRANYRVSFWSKFLEFLILEATLMFLVNF
jgi:hypothetical protein